MLIKYKPSIVRITHAVHQRIAKRIIGIAIGGAQSGNERTIHCICVDHRIARRDRCRRYGCR